MRMNNEPGKYYDTISELSINNLVELYIISFTKLDNSEKLEESTNIIIPNDFYKGIKKLMYINMDNDISFNKDLIEYTRIIDFDLFYNDNNKWLKEFNEGINNFISNNILSLDYYKDEDNNINMEIYNKFIDKILSKYKDKEDIVNLVFDLAKASSYYSLNNNEKIKKLK